MFRIQQPCNKLDGEVFKKQEEKYQLEYKEWEDKRLNKVSSAPFCLETSQHLLQNKSKISCVYSIFVNKVPASVYFLHTQKFTCGLSSRSVYRTTCRLIPVSRDDCFPNLKPKKRKIAPASPLASHMVSRRKIMTFRGNLTRNFYPASLG